MRAGASVKGLPGGGDLRDRPHQAEIGPQGLERRIVEVDLLVHGGDAVLATTR